jgi:hypothetical protein
MPQLLAWSSSLIVARLPKPSFGGETSGCPGIGSRGQVLGSPSPGGHAVVNDREKRLVAPDQFAYLDIILCKA